jgi:arylsulfatase A-like enzyme
MNKTLSLTLLLGSSLALTANDKPNIIIIYVDDMGYGDISCNGGTITHTGNIDRLAEEGIRFTQYYSAAPISSPSRTGITTGMYPTRWGIRTFLQSRKGNARAEQNDFLSDKAPSMARMLKENGYATGHFGKWHMGGGRDVDNAPAITKYGFDEYKSTWESPDPDKLLTSIDWIWSDTDSIKRWNRTAYFVDKTLDFIKRHPDKPCFVNLWPDDVHSPFVPNPDELATDKNDWDKQESFTVVLKELDVQIGRLMKGLKELGVDENTLVIFTSDNGPNPSYQNKRTVGLRGMKGTLYEGGIRMPFIVRWPKKVAPGQVNDQSVLVAVDLFPSLCKITGAKMPCDYLIDGEDRSSLLLGGKNVERNQPVFWEFNRNQSASGDDNSQRVSPQIAVREGDWKLLVNQNGSKVELYNLITDVNETTNVAAKNPAVATSLKKKALAWYKKSVSEFAK